MAEAAGLAIGAVGLAGLFTTCVECLDCIDTARNHGRDYELSITKLLLLKAKLNAWGRSLQVTDEGRENPVLRDHWREEQENVRRCLIGIKIMFEEVDKIESRYGLRPLLTGSGTIYSPQEQRSNAFFQIETVFRSKITQRQETVSIRKNPRWAIQDKKKFDSMIAELSFLIDGLADLSDRLQVLELQQRLLQVQVQAITDTGSIRLMEEASHQLQLQARSQATTIGNKQGQTGHTYISTIIKDRAKVLNGNIGIQSQNSHMYRGTQISGDARAVQGDTSNEAALAFLR